MMREIIIIMCFFFECIGVYRMMREIIIISVVFCLRCIGVYRMMREIIIISLFFFECIGYIG